MRLAAVLLAAVLLVVPASAAARGETAVLGGQLTFDSGPNEIVRAGPWVYLSGDFKEAAPYTGPAIALDPSSGDRLRFPVGTVQVSDAIADGRGGLYLAGDFTELDGVRRNGLAHVLPDGSLDPAFKPELNQFANALALDGDRLYAGFYLSGSVIALDSRSGDRIAGFRAELPPPGAAAQPIPIRELLHTPAAGGRRARLYVGTTESLTALDPGSGERVPGFQAQGGRDVTALAAAGGRLLVGSSILQALDPDTGAELQRIPVTAGAGSGTSAPAVHTLLPDGARVLAGGAFGELAGAPGPVVSLDSLTLAPQSGFRTRIGGSVFDLVLAGGALWAGGEFGQASGPRNLTALDPATGAGARRTAPLVAGPVNALVGGSKLVVGGQFQYVDPWRRTELARTSARTGNLDPGWRVPAPKGDWRLVDGDSDLLLFQAEVGAESTRYLALDPRARRTIGTTGGFKGVNATALEGRRLAVLSGAPQTERERRGRTVAGPYKRARVEVVDLGNRRKLASFRLPFKGFATDVVLSGEDLYVAGSFMRVRPSGARADIAVLKLDLRTGTVVPGFDPHVNGPVYDMARADGRLYMAGLFNTAGPRGASVRRAGFAAADLVTGAPVKAFAPRLYPVPTRGMRSQRVVDIAPAGADVQTAAGALLVSDDQAPFRFDLVRSGSGASAGSLGRPVEAVGGRLYRAVAADRGAIFAATVPAPGVAATGNADILERQRLP